MLAIDGLTPGTISIGVQEKRAKRRWIVASRREPTAFALAALLTAHEEGLLVLGFDRPFVPRRDAQEAAQVLQLSAHAPDDTTWRVVDLGRKS